MRLLALPVVLLMVLSSGIPILTYGSDSASAASLSGWTRTFHLHDGAVFSTAQHDWLNSSGPYDPGYNDYDGDGFEGVTIRKNVPPQRYHVWVLYPDVGWDVSLSGPMSVYLWARSRDNESGSQITAAFYDMQAGELSDPSLWTLIGETTIPMVGPVYSQFKPYNLTVPSVSYTLLQGHFLVLYVQRGDSLNDGLIVHYDKSDYDSYVTLGTQDFVSMDEGWLQDTVGIPRSVYSDFEPVIAHANVSNPFGANDTTGAMATPYYASNGSAAATPTSLVLVQTDPSARPGWRLFEGALPSLGSGDYIVNISAGDSQGYPTWINVSLTVVAADHFGVAAPSAIEAWTPFAMTVAALDASDAVITNWVGTVQLDAYLPDMVTGGSGSLSNSTVVFTAADLGQVSITDQTYSFGEETIVIRASAGTHLGWSSPISVSSGPVTSLTIGPPGQPVMDSGDTLGLDVVGYDAYGNENTSWTPTWEVVEGAGSIIGSGLSVDFAASAAGTVNITCTNQATGALDFILIDVVSGGLSSINISSPSYPLVIREAESQALLATGYDDFGNVVDISGATWDTNTSGALVGGGSSATYTAGYIPEIGAVNVRVGTVVATLNVVVLNSLYGPWMTPIPIQIKNEDSGSWTLSLSGYWQDINGTAGLTWWAEDVDASLYFVSHDPTSNAGMIFYTQPDQFGEDEFTLWVIDPDGFRAYQTLTVRILAVNDKPQFVHNPPTTLVVKNDTLYTFDYTYYVADVDDPKVDLELSVVPAAMSSNIYFDGLIATFLFPRRSGETTYFEFATIVVSDPSMDTAQWDLVVKVTDDNPPSLTNPLPDVTIEEGCVDEYLFDLDDHFVDLDDDFLVYSSGFENVLVKIDDVSHAVYASAPYEWSGVTEGTFTAWDPEDAMKVDTIKITVVAVNDAPGIQSIPDVHVKYDVAYSLYLSPYVNDPDHPLDSLTFTLNDSHVTHVLSMTGSHMLEILFPGNLSGGPYTEPYAASVSLNVTDPLGESAEQEFEVLVSDNSPPIVIAPNPEQLYFSFAEDTYLNGSIRLNELFFDPDDAALNYLFYNYTNIYPSIGADGVVNLTAKENWSGSEQLRVIALDAKGGWATLGVSVTVTEVNDAPHISQIRDIIVQGGPRNMRVYILANLTDSDDLLSALQVSPSPVESISYVGGELFIELPKGIDVITVRIVASDGELDSNMVTFKVGVSKTTADLIGWPYSFPLVLLAAGVAAYFVAGRIPRPYALENLFLIHNDGRLVTHVTKEENTTLDKDVVSAMFTAVQEFVKDSFQKGEVGLKKLEIGDKNVVIEKGQFAYVALIYSGWPPKDVFQELPMLMRDVEERFKGRLEKWNGTMKPLKGVDKMLQDFMGSAYRPGSWQQEDEFAEEEWVDILSKEG